MNYLLKSQVHGPVDFQFVRDKFKAEPGRQQVGTYLIRQSCDNHFTYFLHYMSESGEKVIYILQSKETDTFSIDKSTIKGKMYTVEILGFSCKLTFYVKSTLKTLEVLKLPCFSNY